MEKGTYPGLVREYFGYLTKKYGYSVTEDLYSRQAFSDGIIEFYSDSTIVSIRFDKGEISIDIGPSTEPNIARLSLWYVIDFLSKGKSSYLINFEGLSGDIKSQVEYKLATYGKLLREYCDSILRGDFSWWLDALKYFINKMNEIYRSRTGEEMPENKELINYIKSKENIQTMK